MTATREVAIGTALVAVLALCVAAQSITFLSYHWSTVTVKSSNEPPPLVSPLPDSLPPEPSKTWGQVFPSVFDNSAVNFNFSTYFQDGNRIDTHCGLFYVEMCATNKTSGDTYCSSSTVQEFSALFARWAVLAEGESGFERMDDASLGAWLLLFAAIVGTAAAGISEILVMVFDLESIHSSLGMLHAKIAVPLFVMVCAFFFSLSSPLLYWLRFGPSMPKYFHLGWAWWAVIGVAAVLLCLCVLQALRLVEVVMSEHAKEHAMLGEDDPLLVREESFLTDNEYGIRDEAFHSGG